MITRLNVKCNFCKCNILLRFQMGEFDIPFSFNCPECNVNINGTRRMTSKNPLELNNAELIDEGKEPINYFADFSTELPQRKIQKYISFEQMYSTGFSPFMDMIGLFDEQEYYLKIVKTMQSFINFRENSWNRLKAFYDLYFNNKIELIKEPILEFSPNYKVNNKLDAAMALHQLSTIGIARSLKPNTLEEFTSYANKIFTELDMNETKNFLKTLKNDMDFDFQLKRLIKIYSRWMEDFEKYMPMVTIALGNLREKFNKELYGISTNSLEDMIDFYQDTYELMMDMTIIPIGLNNIIVREKNDIFPPESNIENYNKYFDLGKPQRLKALILDEPFSKYIEINRNVRNAIAHYTYDFNSSTQKITFYDKYKNNENEVELYLCDLALLCYDNITILTYLNELFYNLRKIDLLNEGLKPNIIFKR